MMVSITATANPSLRIFNDTLNLEVSIINELEMNVFPQASYTLFVRINRSLLSNVHKYFSIDEDLISSDSKLVDDEEAEGVDGRSNPSLGTRSIDHIDSFATESVDVGDDTLDNTKNRTNAKSTPSTVDKKQKKKNGSSSNNDSSSKKQKKKQKKQNRFILGAAEPASSADDDSDATNDYSAVTPIRKTNGGGGGSGIRRGSGAGVHFASDSEDETTTTGPESASKAKNKSKLKPSKLYHSVSKASAKLVSSIFGSGTKTKSDKTKNSDGELSDTTRNDRMDKIGKIFDTTGAPSKGVQLGLDSGGEDDGVDDLDDFPTVGTGTLGLTTIRHQRWHPSVNDSSGSRPVSGSSESSGNNNNPSAAADIAPTSTSSAPNSVTGSGNRRGSRRLSVTAEDLMARFGFSSTTAGASSYSSSSSAANSGGSGVGSNNQLIAAAGGGGVGGSKTDVNSSTTTTGAAVVQRTNTASSLLSTRSKRDVTNMEALYVQYLRFGDISVNITTTGFRLNLTNHNAVVDPLILKKEMTDWHMLLVKLESMALWSLTVNTAKSFSKMTLFGRKNKSNAVVMHTGKEDTVDDATEQQRKVDLLLGNAKERAKFGFGRK
jgi:hypothetical protein